MTAEEKVKLKFPDAEWSGPNNFKLYSVWNTWRPTRYREVLGIGFNKQEAWSDAASRLSQEKGDK